MLCPCWTKPPCVNGHTQLGQLYCANQSDMLKVYHSLAHLFLFRFLVLLCISSSGCLSCNNIPCPCYFLLLMWLSLPMLCSIIGPFIFRVLGFPSSVLTPDLVLCAKCILPCKNSRLLHYCFTKWTFRYQIRWLP